MTDNNKKPLNNDQNVNNVDIFRDTPIRYLGYSNEVGESFGTIYPRLVLPSYFIAFGYVFADTYYKTNQSIARGDSNVKSVRIGVDTLIWQTLASVLIPGQVIRLITQSSNQIFRLQYIKNNVNSQVCRWSPTVIGLSAIPLIIKPIDHFVDHLMNETIRKL